MKIKDSFTPQTLTKLGGCLVILASFYFVLLLPSQKGISDTKAEIASITNRIKQQEMFYPVYLRLKHDISAKVSDIYTQTRHEPLTLEQMNNLAGQLSGVAVQAGLASVSVKPDPDSLEGDGNSVMVKCVLSGEFERFRDYLIALGNLPYRMHVSEIQMQEQFGECGRNSTCCSTWKRKRDSHGN